MRVLGPSGTTYGAPAQGPRKAGATGFALPFANETPSARATSGSTAPTNIDSLLAMQGVDDSLERRRRSVQKGRGALDLLDELKMAMLAGGAGPSGVARLRAAAADLKASSGDPGLDAVMSEIDLRVEVELAKATRGYG